jgi:hypothetical protein
VVCLGCPSVAPEQGAAQTVINLMRTLDIFKPQEALRPPAIHIHFARPRDKINE